MAWSRKKLRRKLRKFELARRPYVRPSAEQIAEIDALVAELDRIAVSRRPKP